MPDTTQLAFHPLTFVAERDGVMVGRPDTEAYAVLPADGAQLLRRLAGGMPVAEAARWYQATYHETVDIADFLAGLRELGFVRGQDEAAAAPRTVRYRWLGALAFSPAAWACYLVIVAACAATMTRYPQLRPAPGHIFFVRSLVIVQLTVFVTQVPALLWHEWFHWLAARRLGLPSRLTMSRRLFFAVFETHLNGLLGVPRRQRYLPFLAGMVADVLLFSGLTLVAAADRTGALALPGRLALAAAYVTLLRLAWQFCAFLRTDTYYVLATALGCTSLAEASSAYLRGRLRRLRGQPAPAGAAAEFSPRDQALAPWFALLTLAGVTAVIAGAAIGILPAAAEFAVRLASGLAHGTAGGTRFWDSAVSLMITIAEFGLLPLLAGGRVRGWLHARKTAKGTLA